MAKKPTRDEYARLLGEITIEWNYLVKSIHYIGQYLLKCDQDTAESIFAAMGNTSKTTVLKHLIENHHLPTNVKEHFLYLLRGFDKLRENRNKLEHSVPYQTLGGTYKEAIIKRNSAGKKVSFGLSENELQKILQEMTDYRRYADTISAAVYPDAGRGFQEIAIESVAALPDKPPPPHNVTPLQHSEDHQDE